MVAEGLNRRWIGIDISEKYAEMSRERIEESDWSPDEDEKMWNGDEKIPIEKLTEVSGIGEKTMENVREENQYMTVDRLLDVYGIGEKTVERIIKDLHQEFKSKNNKPDENLDRWMIDG